MSLTGTALIISCIFSGIILCVLGMYSRQYRAGPVAVPYQFLMYAAAFWAFDYALDLAVTDLRLKILLMEIRFIVLPFLSLLELWLVLAYLGKETWIRRWWVYPLAGIGVVTTGLALTSTAHTLFRYDYHVLLYGGISVLAYTAGIWYGVHSAVLYGTLLVVAGLLIFVNRPRGFRALFQRIVLVVVLVFPAIPSLLMEGGLSPVPGVNMTPVLFWILGFLYFWILFPADFFGIIPVARDRIIEEMQNPVIVLDPAHHLVDMNAAAASLAGSALSASFGRPIDEVFSRVPELARYCRTAAAKAGDQVIRGGNDRVYLLKADLMKGEAGRPDATILTLQDITERLRMEEDLQKSEEKFRNIFDSINDAVHIHGVGAGGMPERILEVNDAACRMLGYSREELLTKSPLELVTGYHSRPLEEIGNDLVTKGQAIFETEHIRRDSVIIPVEINAHVSTLAGNRVVVSVVRDITDRKQAEQEIRKSEQRYRSLFENMQEGLAYCRMIYEGNGEPSDFIYLAINPAFDRIIGMGTVTGKPVTEIFPGIRQTFPQLFTIYGRVARTGVPESFELDFTPAGKLLHISVYSPAREYFVAVFNDITDTRRAEEAIRRSEQTLRESQIRLANAMDLAHLVSWEADIQTSMFTFDKRFYALYGTTPEREGGTTMPVDVYVKEFIHPDDAERVTRVISEAIKTRDPAASTQVEHRIIRRDGQVRHIVVRFSVIVDAGGNPVRTYGANQDITDRRKMEEALEESRQLFSDITSFLPDPTFVIDREGRVLTWNRALELLSGVPAGEIIGKGDYEYSVWQYGERRPVLIDLVQNPDKDAARLNYTNIRRQESTVFAETFVTLPSRGRLDLSLVASPLFDSRGGIAGAIESIRDITAIKDTERKLADLNRTLEQRVTERTRELEAAKNYNRSLIEADPDPLFFTSPDGRIQDMNGAAEKMLGAGREALIGTLILDYARERDLAEREFATSLESGRVSGSRYRILGRNGTETPVIASAVLLRDAAGTPLGVFVSLHDITQILQGEEQINAQLREKEVLLREIHHRVKNNLQIIVSLISLQTRTLHDADVIEALRDTQNRVRAISIVHEHLYLSKDLGTVDFGAYLRYLATGLYVFYQKNPADIRLFISAPDAILDIDTASPLGIIFNELISNMLKYAFPGGSRGECTITAHREGRSLVLSIQDNGAGMPETFDWQNIPTLGLRLVSILIEQLNGTITLERAGGTRFVITIPLPEQATGIHRVGGL